MTTAEGCAEGVETIRGQEFLFTGKVYVDGKWETRDACIAMLASRHSWAVPTARESVDVLVFGDLVGSKTVDEKNGHDQKAHFAFAERLADHHVHVVDGFGFTSLLNGGSAKCLDLVKDSPFAPLRVITDNPVPVKRPVAAAVGSVRVPTPAAATIQLFGLESSTSRPEVQQTASKVKSGPVDWDLWTREQVRRQLITAMRSIGVVVHDPGPGVPRFAGVWRNKNTPGAAFVAEIHVVGNVQDEPVQDGLDRLLDYVRRVPNQARASDTLMPVLVLEHEPLDRDWVGRARDLGVHLTWPAKFPGHVSAE